MVARGLSDATSDALRKDSREANLLHVEGTAWDVAQAILFFAGEDSRWITGQGLIVDGGVTVAQPAPEGWQYSSESLAAGR
jgi:NAD(P)-dependent dehydrogenase (short-subunit alcohol dehydrogenase family)